jgi:hypothetical protein
VNFFKNSDNFSFTRMYAHIVEEDEAFTVRVRMINHLKHGECAYGEETAATFEMASLMVGSLAAQFAIPQTCISMKIVMRRFKDGTLH